MTRRVVVALAILLTLPTMACKHPVTPPDELTLRQPPVPPLGSDGARAEGLQAAAEAVADNFRRVHFALDSSSLDAEAREALDRNAELLARFPALKVEVQGHADQRGTVDYNLALGQRRAKAVVDHLQARGVTTAQLRSVSLGEEQPLRAGAGEVAWSANRRAEFRVLTPGMPVAGTTTASLRP